MSQFIWTVDPIKKIGKLKKGLQNKAQRIACNKAASPVKAEVVAQTPVRYGFTRKAMRIRVREYKGKSIFVSIVGPKGDFVRNKGKYKTGEKKGQPIRHRPALYARLVSGGTKTIRARHFLSVALNSVKRYPVVYCETLREQIKQLLRN